MASLLNLLTFLKTKKKLVIALTICMETYDSCIFTLLSPTIINLFKCNWLDYWILNKVLIKSCALIVLKIKFSNMENCKDLKILFHCYCTPCKTPLILQFLHFQLSISNSRISVMHLKATKRSDFTVKPKVLRHRN